MGRKETVQSKISLCRCVQLLMNNESYHWVTDCSPILTVGSGLFAVQRACFLWLVYLRSLLNLIMLGNSWKEKRKTKCFGRQSIVSFLPVTGIDFKPGADFNSSCVRCSGCFYRNPFHINKSHDIVYKLGIGPKLSKQKNLRDIHSSSLQSSFTVWILLVWLCAVLT